MKKEKTKFKVKVNYDLSLEKLIKERKFGNSEMAVTFIADNFLAIWDKTGEVDIEIRLVYFDHPITTNEILYEINQIGFRAAEIPELLALGSQFPDIHKQFPAIVALGSIKRRELEDYVVPILLNIDDEQHLLVFPADIKWVWRIHFAIVRK